MGSKIDPVWLTIPVAAKMYNKSQEWIRKHVKAHVPHIKEPRADGKGVISFRAEDFRVWWESRPKG